MEYAKIGEDIRPEMEEPMSVTFSGEESAELAFVLLVSHAHLTAFASTFGDYTDLPDQVKQGVSNAIDTIESLVEKLGARQYGLPDPHETMQ